MIIIKHKFSTLVIIRQKPYYYGDLKSVSGRKASNLRNDKYTVLLHYYKCTKLTINYYHNF